VQVQVREAVLDEQSSVLRALGAADGPKASPDVIKAVVPGAELKRREGKWIAAMPYFVRNKLGCR